MIREYPSNWEMWCAVAGIFGIFLMISVAI